MAETLRLMKAPAWRVEWGQWHDRLATSPRWRWIELAVVIVVLFVTQTVWTKVTGQVAPLWQVISLGVLWTPLVGLAVNRWERRRVRRAIGPRS